MADDTITDLIDQLLAESDAVKQKAILAQVCKLLYEERERCEAERMEVAG